MSFKLKVKEINNSVRFLVTKNGEQYLPIQDYVFVCKYYLNSSNTLVIRLDLVIKNKIQVLNDLFKFYICEPGKPYIYSSVFGKDPIIPLRVCFPLDKYKEKELECGIIMNLRGFETEEPYIPNSVNNSTIVYYEPQDCYREVLININNFSFKCTGNIRSSRNQIIISLIEVRHLGSSYFHISKLANPCLICVGPANRIARY